MRKPQSLGCSVIYLGVEIKHSALPIIEVELQTFTFDYCCCELVGSVFLSFAIDNDLSCDLVRQPMDKNS